MQFTGGFATRRAEADTAPGTLERIFAVARQHLGAGKALPFTPVLLGEPRIKMQVLESEAGSGLAGAQFGTAIDHRSVETFRRPQRPHLRLAGFRQRRIDSALHAALRVPIGRAVTEKSDLHAARLHVNFGNNRDMVGRFFPAAHLFDDQLAFDRAL